MPTVNEVRSAKQVPAPPSSPSVIAVQSTNWAPTLALAGVIVAATITFAASVFGTRDAFDSKMVEIGIGILSADPTKSDVTPARQWAIDLVEKHSGQPFSDEDRKSLLHHAIVSTVTIKNTPIGLVAAGCGAFRKNPDGSWTQTGKIVNTFEGNSFKGTGEARLLDQLCQ
jgi:hypothetical protein